MNLEHGAVRSDRVCIKAGTVSSIRYSPESPESMGQTVLGHCPIQRELLTVADFKGRAVCGDGLVQKLWTLRNRRRRSETSKPGRKVGLDHRPFSGQLVAPINF